jgi:DNA-binding GntR family transcriptional regulator
MKSINASNLSDAVAEYIRDKIIKMEYKPGDRIVELKIAKELKVSQSPIREAIRVLERNRLVKLIPRKGAYVTELKASDIESLYEILCELLVLVEKKCIQHYDADTFKPAVTATEKALIAARNNDSDTFYHSVIEFGIACLSASKDTLLEQIIYELLPTMRRILYLSVSYRDKNLTENVDLLTIGKDAIMNKNHDKAEDALRKWMKKEKDNSIKGLKNWNLLKKRT